MKHIDSSNALPFEQTHAAVTSFPEHVFVAKRLINRYLGYLPDKTTCATQLPYIQALIENYQKGRLDYKTYYSELEIPIRLIRNRDMNNTWWVIKFPFDDYDYTCYNSDLTHNKYRAREELSYLLKYEPQLTYSLHSEMMLRRLYQSDVSDVSDEYNETCLYAMATTLYRETFLKDGRQAAEQTALLGQRLYKEVNLCPITGKTLDV